jgi:hypothetical protein
MTKNLGCHSALTGIRPQLARQAVADMEQAVWERAAVGQDAHLGTLRSICNALFLSVYHGPNAYDVMRRVYFRALSHEDIRPAIGAARRCWGVRSAIRLRTLRRRHRGSAPACARPVITPPR